MGAGGVPNRTVEIVYGRSGDLPTKTSKPNSRIDLISNGERIQSRWFDDKGNVIRNRDYKHQNTFNNHFFSHDHIWTWINNEPIRDTKSIEPDYELYER